MVIRILSLVGIFVFVKDQSDLILYTFVMAGSQLLEIHWHSGHMSEKINKVPETDLGRGGTPHQAESGIVHSGTGDQYLQCHGQDYVRNYEYGCTGRLL